MTHRSGPSTPWVTMASVGTGFSDRQLELPDVVGADHLTGAHPDPEGVLEWLRGNRPYPWRGPADFPEDTFIYDELLRRIRTERPA